MKTLSKIIAVYDRIAALIRSDVRVVLRGHPKAANEGQLKTGQRE